MSDKKDPVFTHEPATRLLKDLEDPTLRAPLVAALSQSILERAYPTDSIEEAQALAGILATQPKGGARAAIVRALINRCESVERQNHRLIHGDEIESDRLCDHELVVMAERDKERIRADITEVFLRTVRKAAEQLCMAVESARPDADKHIQLLAALDSMYAVLEDTSKHGEDYIRRIREDERREALRLAEIQCAFAATATDQYGAERVIQILAVKLRERLAEVERETHG